MSIQQYPTTTPVYDIHEFNYLNPQPGSNNTEFTFNTRVYVKTNVNSPDVLHSVVVYLRTNGVLTKQVENSNYTILPIGESFKVKFFSPVPAGTYVQVKLDMSYTRDTDHPANKDVSPQLANLQGDNDKTTEQQNAFDITRAVLQPYESCYDDGTNKRIFIVIKDYVAGNLLKIDLDPALNSTFKITDAGVSAQSIIDKYNEIVDKYNQIILIRDDIYAKIQQLVDMQIHLNDLVTQVLTKYAEILTIYAQIQDIQTALEQMIILFRAELANFKTLMEGYVDEVAQLKQDVIGIKNNLVIYVNDTIADLNQFVQDTLNAMNVIYGQMQQIKAEIIALMATIPTPVGQAADFTLVTAGPNGPNANKYELRPYIDLKTPLGAALPDQILYTNGLGSIIPRDKYWFVNGGSGITNAPDGSVLTVGRDINNNKQLVVSTSALANTEQVAAVDPFTEGGTDQMIINENNTILLDSLTPGSSKNPFGDTDLLAEFVVDQNGNLRRSKTAISLSPSGTPTVLKEKLGTLNYYTTNATYTIPYIIGGQNILDIPFSVIFCLKVDSTAVDSTTVLNNSSFGVILKKLSLDYFLQTGTLLEVPVRVGEYTFYVFTYNPKNPSDTYNKVEGIQGYYAANSVTVNQIAAQDMINPPAAGDLTLTLNDSIRLARIAFIKGTISSAELSQYIKYVFGVFDVNSGGGGGGPQYVPNPATGTNGQAPVISNNAYILKDVVTLDNPMNGYTVNGFMNLTTQLPADGDYNFILNRSNNQISLKANPSKTSLTLDNPQAGVNVDGSLNLTTQIPAAGKYALIADRTGTNVTVNADPLTNFFTMNSPTAGYTVDGALNIGTNLPNDGSYRLVLDRSNNQITLKAEQMYTKRKPVTTKYLQPISHTTPAKIASASDLVESRFIENLTDQDIVIGNLADLTTDVNLGTLLKAGVSQTRTDNADLYMIAVLADITVGWVNVTEIQNYV